MIFKELNRSCGLTFLQSFSERWSSHVLPCQSRQDPSPHQLRWTGDRCLPLQEAFSLSLRGRAEVTMTRMPGTLYACKAYGRPVEKSTTNLAFDSADT